MIHISYMYNSRKEYKKSSSQARTSSKLTILTKSGIIQQIYRQESMKTEDPLIASTEFTNNKYIDKKQ